MSDKKLNHKSKIKR